jgi:hypothetical protein
LEWIHNRMNLKMKIKSKAFFLLFPFLWTSFTSSIITNKTLRNLKDAIAERDMPEFESSLTALKRAPKREQEIFFKKNPELFFLAIELLPPAALQFIKMGNIFLPTIYHHVHTIVPRFYDRFSEEKRKDVKTARIDTPLHTAAEFGRALILSKLIKAHQGVNITKYRNSMHSTPLHVASTEKVARILLKAGASLDAQDIHHNTPLDCALNSEVKQVLLLALKK